MRAFRLHASASLQERHALSFARGDAAESMRGDSTKPGSGAPAGRNRSLGDARIDAGQLYETQLHRALRRGVSVRRPVSADLIGKLCVVGRRDESVLIKKIRQGSKPGLY